MKVQLQKSRGTAGEGHRIILRALKLSHNSHSYTAPVATYCWIKKTVELGKTDFRDNKTYTQINHYHCLMAETSSVAMFSSLADLVVIL